jgi:hypothetical protein
MCTPFPSFDTAKNMLYWDCKQEKLQRSVMAAINDVVLIYMEDSPVSFARVENIQPDHKKDWFQITLLLLQIPLQEASWILKDNYINGDEFHMNGKKMRIETVKNPKNTQEVLPDMKPVSQKQEQDPSETGQQASGKIISFSDLQKKNHDQDPG